MASQIPSDVQQLATPKDFDDYIKSTAIVNKLLLVHIELEHVPVCKTVNDALLAISRNEEFHTHLTICRLNADHFSDFLTSYHVTAAPTILFYHRTKLIDRVNGFNQRELIKKVQRQLNTIDTTPMPAESKPDGVNVTKKIHDLLRSSPVILFMKGTPKDPRCGFSRQACHILDQQKIKYAYFDILSDPHVREQLKIHANWNTYPQLFVEGEFIGGLDTIKQMIENGEFASKFPYFTAYDKGKNMTKYLESIIHRSPLMLFISGTAEQPRCGFTKELIQLLDKINVTDYKTFDILQDDIVRENLKEYSSWQTYPQIYVNGQFVGGLDALKQMYEDDTLVQVLTANRGVSV